MTIYSTHAAICAKFYELTLDSQSVSKFVFTNSQSIPGESGLFVGGMFEVANGLFEKGLKLTVVDYTNEMVEIGRSKLSGILVEKADLRSLPYENKFDVIFVVGRVFTHMISNDDLAQALIACRRALRTGGRLFFDNYENSKIQATNYFNGTMQCQNNGNSIQRNSSTTKLLDSPFVVRWDAEYTGIYEGKEFSFLDSMEHRAFSRKEIATALPHFGFELLEQGDNFDETSFFSLARAI